MAKSLRIKLEGDEATLGDVPAADVARLILGIELAVARAAEQIAGRRPGLTGRKGAVVEAATHFRLVSIKRGSVVAELALPPLIQNQDEIDLLDPSLGELALDMTLDTLLGSESNPHIAERLVQTADEVGIGTRYSSLTFDELLGRRRVRRAVLDPGTRDRLYSTAERATGDRRDSVVGTVFEADFEKNSAKLRTVRNQTVSVTFSDELADDVQDLLRHQGELRGHVYYDENTGEAKRIAVQRIVRTEQLLVGVEPDQYWQHRSVSDLIAERATPVANDSAAIVSSEISPEEAESFLIAISEE